MKRKEKKKKSIKEPNVPTYPSNTILRNSAMQRQSLESRGLVIPCSYEIQICHYIQILDTDMTLHTLDDTYYVI